MDEKIISTQKTPMSNVSSPFPLKEMVFSYFKEGGYKQTVPTKTMSVSELIVYLTQDERLKERTGQLRELRRTGNEAEFKEMKNKSPFITASAVMNGTDKTKKSITSLSGFVMIDVDSHSATAAAEFKANIKACRDLPWALAFNSISDGSKLLVAYDKEHYSTEQAYRAAAAYLVEKLNVNPEHIDKGCANANRLTYLYHDSEALLNPVFREMSKDAFPIDEWVKKGEKLFGQVKTLCEKSTAERSTDAGNDNSEVDEAEVFVLNKMKNNLLRAAKYIALKDIHVCDSFLDYFQFVTGIAHDFPHDEEVKEACRNVCKHSDKFNNDDFEKLYSDQSADTRSDDQKSFTLRTSLMMCMDALGKSERWSKGSFSSNLSYKKLPEIMRRLKELDTDPTFRDFYMLGALSMLGVVNKMHYIKANGQKGSTNVYVLFIGSPANNKSKLNVIFKMPSLIDEELKQKTDGEIAEWEAKEDIKAPKPHRRTFTFSPDTTTRGLINNLVANNGRGCITTTEAQHLVVSKNQKNGYGDINTALCQAYEQEPINIDRADDTVRISNPTLSLVATATPDVLNYMMDARSFDSGFASRCAIYELPDVVEFFDLGDRDTNFEQNKKKGTETYLMNYFRDFYHMCQTLRKDVIVKTTPEQDTQLQMFTFGAYYHYHDTIFVSDGYTKADNYAMPVARRAFDRALRIATIMTVLDRFEKRRAEGKTTFFDDGEVSEKIYMTDDIVRDAIVMSKTLFAKTFQALKPQIKAIKEQTSLETYKQKKKSENFMVSRFKKLPESFGLDEAREILKLGRSQIYSYMSSFGANKWLEAKNGIYTKLPGSPGYDAPCATASAVACGV